MQISASMAICIFRMLGRKGVPLFLNPGSVSLPRGPIQECLYAKVEIDADSYRVEFLNRKHEVYEPLTKEFDR